MARVIHAKKTREPALKGFLLVREMNGTGWHAARRGFRVPRNKKHVLPRIQTTKICDPIAAVLERSAIALVVSSWLRSRIAKKAEIASLRHETIIYHDLKTFSKSLVENL